MQISEPREGGIETINPIISDDAQRILENEFDLDEESIQILCQIVTSYQYAYHKPKEFLELLSEPNSIYTSDFAGYEYVHIDSKIFANPKSTGSDCFGISIHLARDLYIALSTKLEEKGLSMNIAEGRTPRNTMFCQRADNHVFLTLSKKLEDEDNGNSSRVVIDGSFQTIRTDTKRPKYYIDEESPITADIVSKFIDNPSSLFDEAPIKFTMREEELRTLQRSSSKGLNALNSFSYQIAGLTKDGFGIGLGFGLRERDGSKVFFPIIVVLSPKGHDHRGIWIDSDLTIQWRQTENMPELSNDQYLEISEMLGVCENIVKNIEWF